MKRKFYSVLTLLSISAGALFGQTTTFNFTGGIQTFTVPCGVDSVFIQSWGAQGGAGAAGNSSGGPTSGGAGGLGGYSEGWLLVTPGQTLNIFVGGQGATPAGGFNGGGTAGAQNAGGGGGSSDVRVNGTSESDRVITAGGGGGGGRGGCESGPQIAGGVGGDGGGGNGGNGTNAPTSGGDAGGGFGGIGSTGGAEGIGCSGFLGAPGSSASTGTGGNGGAGQSCCCFSFSSIPGGGGGGGGQIGGGGGGGGSAGTTGCSGNDKGAGGGGAGGTSYTGGVLNGVSNNGIWLGDGMVTITWSDPTPGVLAVTGANVICEFTNTTLTSSTDPNANTYTWTVPSGLTLNSGQNSNIINITGDTPGTYTVSVVGTNTVCTLTGPSTDYVVTVNASPVIAASASSPEICNGDTDTLTVSGASSYMWSSGGTGAMEIVAPTGTTNYTVVGVDANGCMDTTMISVVVNALPIVTATGGTICMGDSITLTATGASTYMWSSGGTDSTEIVSPTSTTTYTVTGTSLQGCDAMAMITVTVNPLPSVSYSIPAGTHCVNDGNFTLTGGSPAGGTYSGTAVTAGSFSPSTSGVGSFAVSYMYTDANGCPATAVDTMVVSACVGINEANNVFGLTLMPNPVTDNLQITWDANKAAVTTLEIFDNAGRLVMTSRVNGGNSTEMNVSSLPAGNYLLSVTTIDSKGTYKFVKE